MAYGFSITSGTGAVVNQQSSENPPGVYLDTFLYIWSTTPATYNYSSFIGTTLLPIMLSKGATFVDISVNNSTKVITITGITLVGTLGRNDAYFVILGW